MNPIFNPLFFTIQSYQFHINLILDQFAPICYFRYHNAQLFTLGFLKVGFLQIYIYICSEMYNM